MSPVNLPHKKQKGQPYLDLSFGLLELVSELLVVIQQGELGLHGSSLQRLQQSAALASLLSELRISLSLQQLQLFTQTAVVSGVALQEKICT